MREHIKLLDILRGLAALGVVFFHYSNSTLPTLKPNPLADLFYYGQYGVQAFFVISGFVIPYSMFKSKYQIHDYFRVLLRRFIRIAPPAYLAIGLTFILYFSSIIILGRPINGMDWPGISWNSILGNLSFCVPYLNTSWFNPVFWTLAIEFQFYVVIGFFLPLLLNQRKSLLLLCLVGTLALGFIPWEWFFKYASFFVLGILLFLREIEKINKKQLLLFALLSLSISYFQSPLPAFLFGAICFGLIWIRVNLNNRFFNHLGKISYSLYITHTAIGLMSEIALKRVLGIHESPEGKVFMMLVYSAISIGFATLFYHWVEKPFIQHSRSIKKFMAKNRKLDKQW